MNRRNKTESTTRVCLVKLGGSVLATAEWPSRLRIWLCAELDDHAETHFVVIVGGGPLVDALRAIDRRAPLGDQLAHWTAIRLMDETARIVGAMLPEIVCVEHFDVLHRRIATPGVTLLRHISFMREVEPISPGVRLPASWDVTSDSIAGRLAVVVAADELVLIKSCEYVSSGPDLSAWSNAGVVDSFFDRLLGELPPVRLTTLR